MVSWALPEGDGDKLQSTGRTQRHWSPPGEDRVCRDMVGTTGLSRTVRAEGADMVGVPDGAVSELLSESPSSWNPFVWRDLLQIPD